MAIKPMQQKNKTRGGQSRGGQAKQGSFGGKGQGMARAREMELAQMYYMKGLQKGMGKRGGGGGGMVYGMPASRNPRFKGSIAAAPVVKTVVKKVVKGQGKGKVQKPLTKYQEKLKKIEKSRLVWIGGLSPKTGWKKLEKHLAEVVKPVVADIYEKKTKDGKVQAKVAFKTEEDVETVVAALNGSELDGEVIEVDKWEKGTFEKKDRGGDGEKKPRRRGGKRQAEKNAEKTSKLGKVVNLKFAKGLKNQGRDEKAMKILKEIDNSCKVWVGGLAEKTSKKVLTKHFADIKKPKIVDLMKKGKAVVAYESEEDAVAAIAALNGSELDGSTLEVDVWTKPDRPPRSERKKNGKAAKEEEE